MAYLFWQLQGEKVFWQIWCSDVWYLWLLRQFQEISLQKKAEVQATIFQFSLMVDQSGFTLILRFLLPPVTYVSIFFMNNKGV